MTADFDQHANDLFWRVTVLNGSKYEILNWSGYNDAYWWKKVATSDHFQLLKAQNGRIYRLNPRTNEVTEERTNGQN